MPNRRQSFIILGCFVISVVFLLAAASKYSTPRVPEPPRPPKYKPNPDWVPPPVKDNFPLLHSAASPDSLPPIPKWNVPIHNAHNTTPLNLPVAPPLFIGFTRTYPLLLQVVTSYITAGWPPSQIYVIENTGVQQSNARGLLSLQNQFFLNHTALTRILGVNVVTTPTLLSFAQMQNFFLSLAYQHDWPYYFWSHMDVVAFSYEGGHGGMTPPYHDPGYKSIYTLALEALQRARNEDSKWGFRFFAYDHLSLVNRDAMEDTGAWDVMVPYYMTDCDMHSRLSMKGWSIKDERAGIITDVASALADLSMLYRVGLEGDVQPEFVDPNPAKPQPPGKKHNKRNEALESERERRGLKIEDRNAEEDDPNWVKWRKLVHTSDLQFQHKHSDRGRNTWQLGQHGGKGEPFYYPAAGLAEAIEVMTETGREIYRRKWGHRDCDLIGGTLLKFDDAWMVRKDWSR
ncbi:hypothetical protein QBC42DRAFT_187910 [Cladorrhinum samala]|uniref:Uncharacterized protein n=1 Tax=Cladorrhinum samala TaxID=585594 RepID=A0AAV9HBR2_9PEZI|nr:hypothetical protein QBC42DRAFT_187910 [Cladorrhinum samala]